MKYFQNFGEFENNRKFVGGNTHFKIEYYIIFVKDKEIIIL